MPNRLNLHCRISTFFTPDDRIDEDALREYLQRLIDADIGVYLAASPLEGVSLSHEELRTVYRVGVEACKGKVFIGANGPEQHTARDTVPICQLGAEAGVDHVNIYGPPGWHVAKPNDAEYIAYYDYILGQFRYPVSLAPNPSLGYSPSAAAVAEVCNRYPQVEAVNTVGQSDMFVIELQDRLQRDVEIYVPLPGSMNMFALGVAGLTGVEAGFIPRTYRQYMDLWERGDFDEAGRVYAQIRRFCHFTLGRNPQWGFRWLKMGMKAFKFPGWEGGIREPRIMPDEQEFERFVSGVLALDIPEVNELAHAAGLA